MIISIVHTKGGVGKSTIACNLAIDLGLDLLDLDFQQSSCKFAAIRELPKNGEFLPKSILDTKGVDLLEAYFSDEKRHLVVDCGGYDDNANRMILALSNLVITPISTSQVELFGLQTFYQIVKDVNEVRPLNAFILFNNIPQKSEKEAEVLQEILNVEFPIYKFFDVRLGARKAFRKSFEEGLSVVEQDKNSIAAREMLQLEKQIKNLLKKG